MTDDTLLPFDLPAVRRKKLTVDFEGGNQSSNGGARLLRESERAVGVCRRLAVGKRAGDLKHTSSPHNCAAAEVPNVFRASDTIRMRRLVPPASTFAGISAFPPNNGAKL
jgi:hypothetical protein